MKIVCLDLEGVLVPEIWIEFSKRTGIPELMRTTREEPDYDKLMTYRLNILREHKLGLPSDLALLIKAFISLEGMGRGLDPGFHMAAEALPLLRQVLRARYQPRALLQRAGLSLRHALATLEQLPGDVSRLLRRARHGQVQVNIELKHLKRVGDQIDHSANRLAMALVIAALIIGSSIVMTVNGGPTLFGLPAFGFLGFCSAAVGALWLIRAIWRSSRHRDIADDD